MTDKQLEILHDHYKETFARVRDMEKSRDRLFLWSIVLYALLSLELGYPAAFGGSMGTLSIAGSKIDIKSLPLPALLSATWVFTLAVALRYCQTSIWVDRHYPYVHLLEEQISPLLGGGNIYRREGKVYLSDYPMLLNVTWIAYVILFPLIALFATAGLVLWEWTNLSYPWYHVIFDSVIAGALVLVLGLYRVLPYVTNKVRARRNKGTSFP